MIKETTHRKIDLERLSLAAAMLRAIAHPMRIAIIDLLDQKERLNVKEIHETLQIEQAVASHHLGILRDKQVLKAEREGKNIFYSIRHDRVGDIIDCVDQCTKDLQ